MNVNNLSIDGSNINFRAYIISSAAASIVLVQENSFKFARQKTDNKNSLPKCHILNSLLHSCQRVYVQRRNLYFSYLFSLKLLTGFDREFSSQNFAWRLGCGEIWIITLVHKILGGERIPYIFQTGDNISQKPGSSRSWQITDSGNLFWEELY